MAGRFLKYFFVNKNAVSIHPKPAKTMLAMSNIFAYSVTHVSDRYPTTKKILPIRNTKKLSIDVIACNSFQKRKILWMVGKILGISPWWTFFEKWYHHVSALMSSTAGETYQKRRNDIRFLWQMILNLACWIPCSRPSLNKVFSRIWRFFPMWARYFVDSKKSCGERGKGIGKYSPWDLQRPGQACTPVASPF